MAKESQSVGLSMGMLCLTMCFIYVVFFGIHGESLQQELAALEAQEGVYAIASDLGTPLNQESVPIASIPDITNKEDISSDSWRPIRETVITKPIAPAPQNTPGRTFFSVQELFYSEPQEQILPIPTSETPLVHVPDASLLPEVTNKILLDETREWDGYMKRLDAVGLIGAKKYILKNMDNTHFVPLTGVPQNFSSFIRSKGGNVVEIAGESAIKEHQLFGDSVRYIHLPEYEHVKVLMIVFFGNEPRFLQIDYDVFEQRKQQLAATFDVRYDW